MSVGRSSAWQLERFAASVKERQRLRVVRDLLGRLDDCRCLLLTYGDNPGALNHHLRALGGSWSWADLDASGIPGMQRFLREPVQLARPDTLPFPNGVFDRVVVVDAHGLLGDVAPLNVEVARVLTVEGVAIIMTPNRRPRRPAALIRRALGRYTDGRMVPGFTVDELGAMLATAGLRPVARAAYGKFFTEIAELALDMQHARAMRLREHQKRGRGVKAANPNDRVVLSMALFTARARRGAGGLHGSKGRLLGAIQAVSTLDRFVPGRDGYAVAIAAMKDG
jgi:SAM-dependent methyltransferase